MIWVKRISTIFLLLFSNHAISQAVAILDQGYNEELKYRGTRNFFKQYCYSYKDYKSPSFDLSLSHTYGHNWRVSLCPGGKREEFIFDDAATHPRADVQLFSSPAPPYKTTKKLTHGRDVSNALHDFDNSIPQILYQVYGLSSLNTPKGPRPSKYQDQFELMMDHRPNYSTSSGRFIAGALERLSINTDPSLGAIAISTVVGDRRTTPRICIGDKLGQAAVNRLVSKGIAVVAGLVNEDIPASAATWPNCLNGVINAGNTNTNFTGDGIGIGANTIDFYANSATFVKEGTNSFTRYGNSLASPKIAAAFSLLHRSNPSSSLLQKYQALERASASRHTYKGFKRRKVTRKQVDKAIVELNKIMFPDGIFGDPAVDFDIGDLIASNPNRFGSSYGGEGADKVEIKTNFSSSPTSLKLRQKSSTTTYSFSDVLVQVTGLIVGSTTIDRKFDVYVNGIKAGSVTGFDSNVEATKTVSISRNFFSEGENTVEIRPVRSTINWGVRDIKLARLPDVPLTFGQKESNVYGSISTPERHTGVEYRFDVATPVDSVISLTGYDIDFTDEIQISINGKFLGNLPRTANNAFGGTASFFVPKSSLQSSDNIIELTQRFPNQVFDQAHERKWAVTNMMITKTLPDVVSENIQLSEKILKKLKPFNVTASFKNNGVGLSPASVIEYYLSTDNNIDRINDTLIGQSPIGSIPQGTTASVTRQISTEFIGEGYFIGACYRPVNAETNKTNNCSRAIKLRSVNGAIPAVITLLMNDEDN